MRIPILVGVNLCLIINQILKKVGKNIAVVMPESLQFVIILTLNFCLIPLWSGCSIGEHALGMMARQDCFNARVR